MQDVGFLVDRDVIRVGSEIGKFDRMRLRVLKNDIFVTDLKAIFDDGQTETLLTDAKIGSNRKTEWIPLKHKGFIKEIQFVYRSQAPTSRARRASRCSASTRPAGSAPTARAASTTTAGCCSAPTRPARSASTA